MDGKIYKVEPMTESMAREICGWEYLNEYSSYNYPRWADLCEQNWTIANTEKRERQFHSVLDNTNDLIGYVRIFTNLGRIEIGLGMKPNLCGKGNGNRFMNTIIQYIKQIYPDSEIILNVRNWNIRAIKCYEKAGFKILRKYYRDTHMIKGEFYEMCLEAK